MFYVNHNIFKKYVTKVLKNSSQVGSERVSSQPTVDKLLNGESVGPENSSNLSVSNPELVAAFRAQQGPQREAWANALLLSMTFLKLAVHEDLTCLKSLHLA